MYMYNEYNEKFELDINYHHFYNQYILVDLIEHNDYKSDTSVVTYIFYQTHTSTIQIILKHG